MCCVQFILEWNATGFMMGRGGWNSEESYWCCAGAAAVFELDSVNQCDKSKEVGRAPTRALLLASRASRLAGRAVGV